jgi:chromosome segregation ATPase
VVWGESRAAAKVATALKLSEDDDATIDSLKKQIEKAWAMVESYHEREIRANETIQRLKGEIGNLTRILEKQTGLAGKDNTVDELLKVREVLTKRNEEAAATIQSMQAEVDAQMAAVDRKRQKNREKKAALLEVRDQVRAKDVEIERENKKKERLDKEIKVLCALPPSSTRVLMMAPLCCCLI